MKDNFSVKAFLIDLNTDNKTTSEATWREGVEKGETWALLKKGKEILGEEVFSKVVRKKNIKTFEQKAREIETKRLKKEPVLQKSYYLLAIDDDPNILEIYEDTFEDSDIRFKGVLSGKAGIKELKANGSPDCLILDYQLSDATGIQLLNTLPVLGIEPKYMIIISGFAEPELIKGAVRGGVVRWIVKPVDPQELRETIESLLSSN